jgi:hypothetical protein
VLLATNPTKTKPKMEIANKLPKINYVKFSLRTQVLLATNPYKGKKPQNENESQCE